MSWIYFVLLGALGAIFAGRFVWVGWVAALVDPFYNAILAAGLNLFWPARGAWA